MKFNSQRFSLLLCFLVLWPANSFAQTASDLREQDAEAAEGSDDGEAIGSGNGATHVTR
jgi:hypothetical protein